MCRLAFGFSGPPCFSTCECSLVVRMCGVFNMACNSVSRRRGVQFFFAQSLTPGQCVCLQAKMNVITPPHPSPPNQSPTPGQCVCLQAKMNVITPPRPTPPKMNVITPPHPTPETLARARVGPKTPDKQTITSRSPSCLRQAMSKQAYLFVKNACA